MAGLLGLFGFLSLTGASFFDTIQKDVYSNASKDIAEKLNKEIYYDGFNRPHWIETNEIVEIINIMGSQTIKGIKTGKIYKQIDNEKVRKQNEIEKMKNNGIKYCKINDIKYFPFYFPNNLIGREFSYNTGIEVETGKKYCCLKWGSNKYYLLYLEDQPHYYRHERKGIISLYDAQHDKEGSSFIEEYDSNIRKERGKRDSWYSTKRIFISEEEYKKRITPIEGYPYISYDL